MPLKLKGIADTNTISYRRLQDLSQYVSLYRNFLPNVLLAGKIREIGGWAGVATQFFQIRPKKSIETES